MDLPIPVIFGSRKFKVFDHCYGQLKS